MISTVKHPGTEFAIEVNQVQGRKEMKTKRQRLGELLIRMKLISADQLADALGEQADLQAANAQRQFKLGEILISHRVITLTQLQAALRIQAQMIANTSPSSTSIRSFNSQSESSGLEGIGLSKLLRGLKEMISVPAFFSRTGF